jgi:hypothetical protein
MKPEILLPCSQDPYTGSYPQPDESNVYHLILSLSLSLSLSKIYFNIVLARMSRSF